jgi:hypothetical protein
VSVDTVEIVITPSEAQYHQLVADLATLRQHGSESNTAAIVAAVSEQADRVRASSPTPLRKAA